MVVKDQRAGEGPSARGSGPILRQQAEARAWGQADPLLESLEVMSPEATRPIVHELRVYQIELEMQNEELRRSQLELDASRARYFDLYDLAPVGYCTVSDSGMIRQANLSAANLLGVERGVLIKKPISRFILREDQDTYSLFRKRIMDTGDVQSCDLRMVKHDGAPVWVHLAATAAQDTDNATVLRVALTDISVRKQAETALRDQKEFFRLIAENIDDFIAVLDLEGRRLYNSPSYLQFFDAQRDLHGSDSFAEIHPEDREYVKQVFRETVHTGMGRQIHYRMLMADGAIRDMESRGSVIRDSEGRVSRVVVVSRDTTERQHLEEQMRQLAFYDSLTQLPNRRLLNDRLKQSMASSTRSGCYGALMFLDLDNFKPLNDAHGHGVGDLLLIEAANRLKSCVREVDTVARFGGDEYVVMMSEVDVDKSDSRSLAESVAEKIRIAIAEPYLLTIEREGYADHAITHHCTASIGIVLFQDHEASLDDILRWADAAMYKAKEAGRNLIRFYDAKN